MITRTIAYTDYDGNQRKEKYYFNLTEFEATEIAMAMPDGVVEVMKDGEEDTNATAVHLVEKLGGKGVIEFIKDIVLKSYGVKSTDGRRFIKSKELSEEFSQTPAFSSFMLTLMRDDVEASNFINGVIPPELAAKIAQKNEPKLVD